MTVKMCDDSYSLLRTAKLNHMSNSNFFGAVVFVLVYFYYKRRRIFLIAIVMPDDSDFFFEQRTLIVCIFIFVYLHFFFSNRNQRQRCDFSIETITTHCTAKMHMWLQNSSSNQQQKSKQWLQIVANQVLITFA